MKSSKKRFFKYIIVIIALNKEQDTQYMKIFMTTSNNKNI